jgi:hypothetical protein
VVEALVVTFSVDVPLPWTGFTVNDPPAPVGRPETVSSMSFEKPPTDPRFTV